MIHPVLNLMHASRESLLDKLIDTAVSKGVQRIRSAQKPAHLYHFTDLRGLTGIIQDGTLWASLASALNDPSETKYALSLATRLLGSATTGRALYRDAVQTVLDRPELLPEFVVKMDPFVTSFCSSAESALHWLHYGRKGTGVVIRFVTDKLSLEGLDLVRILYDRADQATFLLSILEPGFALCDEHLPNISVGRRSQALAVAAHVLAQALRLVSAQLKHPAFTSEDEWRFLTFDFEDHEFHNVFKRSDQ